MRHAGALAPYAVAAVAVVAICLVAVTTSVRPAVPSAEPTAALASLAPAPSGATLSPTARLAYWRTGSSIAEMQLWASDLDGAKKWPIGSAATAVEIALTRWSPDGGSVGYTLGGTTLMASRLDQSSIRLDLPQALRTAKWKIVSFEWSPDGTRVAASVRAASGLSNESDVYVVQVKAGALWEQVTTLGDAFAGQWIDNSRMFIETSSGVVAVLDLTTKQLRPLTGMAATSPLIGRDGRVYVVGGQGVSADVTTQPVASGWVWSMTIDGDDLRRETSAQRGQIRLYGILADGRPLIGVPGAVYVASDVLIPLSFTAGTPRRVVVSDDGKRAIGIADTRVLQVDATKIPRTLDAGPLPPATAATLLLSDVRVPDVWFPTKVGALVKAESARQAPGARLAFTLGKSIWQMDASGTIRLLATVQAFDRPKWSPKGDRLAIPVPNAPQRGSTVGIVSTSGLQLLGRTAGIVSRLEWTPEGQIAVQTSPQSQIPAGGDRFDKWTTQIWDVDKGTGATPVDGRVTYLKGRSLVLTDGVPGPTQIPVGQRIEVVEGSARRVLAQAEALASSPLVKLTGNEPAFISDIAASGDGQYLWAWVGNKASGGTGTGAFVVIRIEDGEVIWVLQTDTQSGPFDLNWSPTGHLLAWTTIEPPQRTGGTAASYAVVRDPATGAKQPLFGDRFGGWAPDGLSYYITKDDGLYAYRVDGSRTVRVSPIGVFVTATAP